MTNHRDEQASLHPIHNDGFNFNDEEAQQQPSESLGGIGAALVAAAAAAAVTGTESTLSAPPKSSASSSSPAFHHLRKESGTPSLGPATDGSTSTGATTTTTLNNNSSGGNTHRNITMVGGGGGDAETFDSQSTLGSSPASMKRVTSLASQLSGSSVAKSATQLFPQQQQPLHQGTLLIPPGVVLYRMAQQQQQQTPPAQEQESQTIHSPQNHEQQQEEQAPLFYFSQQPRNLVAQQQQQTQPFYSSPLVLSQGQLELSGSANNEDNNNNKKSVSCLSGGDTSSMRQDLESPPDHPARTSHAYGSDDWSDRELHHQQQEQQQQQQLTLSQFTPPTSLNDTPTKLFFRYGDSSALDHVDPLVLTPVNTRFNNYTTPLVSPTLLAPMSPFLSTQLVASNMMMMPTTITTHNGIQMHHERQPNAAGSGISTGTTNAAPSSSFLVGSTASSSTSSSVTGRHPQHQPVLYSAIGSLEHPTNSFYKGMRSRAFASTHKFDFPSSSSMLLAPPLHVAAARKQRNALENSNSATNMNIHTINGNVVNATKNNAVTQPRKQQQQTKSLKQVNKSAQKQGLTSALKNIGGKTGGVDDDESKSSSTKSGDKKVTIVHNNFSTTNLMKSKARKSRKQRGPIEMFRPSSDAYTPRMGKKEIKYKPAGMRTPVQQMASPLGTLSRPNFRDALRRVAMIIHQHIVKIELRFESKKSDHRVSSSGSLGAVAVADDGLFSESMKEAFSEDRYITPRYKCTMVRVPMARSGMVCGLKHIRENYAIPSEAEIYEFAHRLFKTVQLSSECSIVCLIYVERLMEAAKVPLLASTWRPIFMCGLLLASKVWQDLSSWNIEFASVYPQYSLSSINRLELQFLRMVQWDLYISSSQYAKYYFALRSLVEKPDFRQRYNRMVGGVDTVHASQARKIEERSSMVKEEALLHLSRSM